MYDARLGNPSLCDAEALRSVPPTTGVAVVLKYMKRNGHSGFPIRMAVFRLSDGSLLYTGIYNDARYQ